MDKKETAAEHYAQMAKKYPIKTRFENTLTQIQGVLEAMDLLDHVTVDTHLLGQCH